MVMVSTCPRRVEIAVAIEVMTSSAIARQAHESMICGLKFTLASIRVQSSSMKRTAKYPIQSRGSSVSEAVCPNDQPYM